MPTITNNLLLKKITKSRRLRRKPPGKQEKPKRKNKREKIEDTPLERKEELNSFLSPSREKFSVDKGLRISPQK